jgi:hypothetical protein
MIKVPQIQPAYENARGSESMPIPIKRAVALKSWVQGQMFRGEDRGCLTVWEKVLCPKLGPITSGVGTLPD